jgi:hypothetical protein
MRPQHLRRTRAQYVSTSTTDSQFSDIQATRALLLIPVGLALMSFVIAAIASSFGEMTPGTLRFYFGAFSYAFVAACFLILPAYLMSFGWFWWSTKNDDQNMKRNLWLTPLVTCVFVWFPAVALPKVSGIETMLKTYILLVGISLVFGYLWIAIVRSVLYFWRK